MPEFSLGPDLLFCERESTAEGYEGGMMVVVAVPSACPSTATPIAKFAIMCDIKSIQGYSREKFYIAIKVRRV